MMDLTPWVYWTKQKRPLPGTTQIVDGLERVMARNPNHPGACHLYIHAVEAAFPERAIACAERLAALMPSAGHIVHMPAHIYLRVGRYDDASGTCSASRCREAISVSQPGSPGTRAEWRSPRHLLGAALLAANRPAEAEQRYREDLARFPENVWSTRGLERSLVAQGKTKD